LRERKYEKCKIRKRWENGDNRSRRKEMKGGEKRSKTAPALFLHEWAGFLDGHFSLLGLHFALMLLHQLVHQIRDLLREE